MFVKMTTKELGYPNDCAVTLSSSEVGVNDSGWTIEGQIHEDYYEWVNYFEASHPDFGRVWGDFEDEVFANSKKSLKNFLEHHAPSVWDYGDI